MPSLALYPFDALDSVEDMAKAERSARQEVIKDHWDYYDGAMQPPLKVRTGQTDDNVILRLCTKMIDQGISMLFGNLPTFDIDKSAVVSEQEMDLKQAWLVNRPAVILHDMGQYGGITGHVFVKLMPQMEGQAVKWVDLQVLDSALVTVFWHPEDKAKVTAYRIGWTQGADQIRQDIIAPGVFPDRERDFWTILDMVQRKGGRWEVVREIEWRKEFGPIVDWQNRLEPRDYYGKSDFVNPELNDRVNFVASNIVRIIKYHAHPRTILTGAQASEIQDTAIDSLWSIPSKEAQVFNLEMQSDLESSRQTYNGLKAEFYAEHRAVDMASLRDKLGNLTNFGLRVLYKDALDKLTTKRAMYGAGLVEISRRMMSLMGQEVEPTITWPKELPYNPLEEIQEIREELELGLISKETAAVRRGIDWEKEQERLEEERIAGAGLFDGLVQALELGP